MRTQKEQRWELQVCVLCPWHEEFILFILQRLQVGVSRELRDVFVLCIY